MNYVTLSVNVQWAEIDDFFAKFNISETRRPTGWKDRINIVRNKISDQKKCHTVPLHSVLLSKMCKKLKSASDDFDS